MTSILVVLPTLGDRLDTLAETLASVEQQRAEVSLTLVVVLPPEAEAAAELAGRHGAVVVHDPRAGISAAINAGIEAATTEQYYAWIGDDDLFRPHGLSRLLALFELHPRAVLAFGGCDYIDPTGRTIGVSRMGQPAVWLLPWGPDLVPHPGSLIRLDAMRSVGLFDRSLKYSMDLDMFLKLRHLGPFVSTRLSVSAFRWHPDSLTVANRRASSAESEAVKRRHLPTWLRPFAPVWELPVRWASGRAARAVSHRARRLGAGPSQG